MSVRRAFGQGIVVNVLNPKVALFFLSFLPQFIHPDDGSAFAQSLVLGAVFVMLATLFNGTYSLVASSLRDLLLRGRTLPFVRRWVSGGLFVGLGVLAATAGHASASTR
jgi:threonine/homoserine/homoserine lactone efflux protein